MKWKIKAHGMAIISRIPGGRRLYHRLQSIFGTNRLDADEGFRRAAEVIELVSRSGKSPRDATVVEIGTGWRPFLPFLLSLAGAKRIVSLDVNPWLTKGYALETYRSLEPYVSDLATQLGEPVEHVRERYERIGIATKTLPAMLAAAGLDYVYPGDARRTELAANSVDFVCSSNVFEHIPPDVLRAIHTESFRIIRPGGLAIHRFNPGDHYAGVDRSITASNFLRFSDREWRWYGGTGLSYHNRLRCVQHREMLREAGFTILVDDVRMNDRALETIRRGGLPIHPDFRSFTPEQLAADYMWLVGKKPMPSVPHEDAERA